MDGFNSVLFLYPPLKSPSVTESNIHKVSNKTYWTLDCRPHKITTCDSTTNRPLITFLPLFQKTE